MFADVMGVIAPVSPFIKLNDYVPLMLIRFLYASKENEH
jgi:hypothetical protein